MLSDPIAMSVEKAGSIGKEGGRPGSSRAGKAEEALAVSEWHRER